MSQQVDRLLRLPAVIERVGLCKASIYKLIKQGEFPKSVRLAKSGRAVAWRESEIRYWVMTRVTN